MIDHKIPFQFGEDPSFTRPWNPPCSDDTVPVATLPPAEEAKDSASADTDRDSDSDSKSESGSREDGGKEGSETSDKRSSDLPDKAKSSDASEEKKEEEEAEFEVEAILDYQWCQERVSREREKSNAQH